MDREIKFRARSVEDLDVPKVFKGQWVYGKSIQYYEWGSIEIDGIHCDRDSLGQATGLYDSKGKEIYENDKIKVITIRRDGYSEHIYSVVFEEGCFLLRSMSQMLPDLLLYYQNDPDIIKRRLYIQSDDD